MLLRDSIPLPELDEGESSELVCLSCEQPARRNTLAVYGLVPGCCLELRQKRPAFVVRVGETELALEPEIAKGIHVRRIVAPTSAVI
jgi:DtxR family transcriptional regulator, Mn-dependent transcriptional regulator